MADERKTYRAIVNAGDVFDLWRAMRFDTPYTVTLTNGDKVELVAGNPSGDQIGAQYAQMDEFEVRQKGL